MRRGRWWAGRVWWCPPVRAAPAAGAGAGSPLVPVAVVLAAAEWGAWPVGWGWLAEPVAARRAAADRRLVPGPVARARGHRAQAKAGPGLVRQRRVLVLVVA